MPEEKIYSVVCVSTASNSLQESEDTNPLVKLLRIDSQMSCRLFGGEFHAQTQLNSHRKTLAQRSRIARVFAKPVLSRTR